VLRAGFDKLSPNGRVLRIASTHERIGKTTHRQRPAIDQHEQQQLASTSSARTE